MPKLSLTILDAFGRTTSKVVEIEEQIDIGTYETVAATYVAQLDDVILGQVVRVDLILEGIAAGTAAPASGANVDVAAVFSGWTDQTLGKKASLRIPTFDTALVGSDGSVDITLPSVEALLNQYETAGPMTLSDGETIDAWISGRLER